MQRLQARSWPDPWCTMSHSQSCLAGVIEHLGGYLRKGSRELVEQRGLADRWKPCKHVQASSCQPGLVDEHRSTMRLPQNQTLFSLGTDFDVVVLCACCVGKDMLTHCNALDAAGSLPRVELPATYSWQPG